MERGKVTERCNTSFAVVVVVVVVVLIVVGKNKGQHVFTDFTPVVQRS